MNMGLALALLGMTTATVALLLVPLIVRNRFAESRDAYNLSVYRDQLAELERDLARGIIGPEEAEAAKSEIGRRILALTPAAAPRPSSTAPLAVAAVAVILLPVAAWALYWQLGSPNLADQPYAARGTPGGAATAAANPHSDMADAVAKLAAHLEAHPDDIEGWVLLGRSDLGLQRYADAVAAYHRAVELSGNNPEIVGDWAEAQVLAADGIVTPAAKEAFQSTLKDPGAAPRSRYYLALAELQAGNAKNALQSWVDLEADSPADAEWLPLLRRRIAEAAKTAGVDPATVKTSSGAPRKTAAAAPEPPAATAPAAGGTSPAADAAANAPAAPGMPSGAAVDATARATANASSEERQAMIEAMVARLAARLEQEPNDAEGWTRLGRSYLVLNKPDKAEAALAHAVKLKPGDLAVKQQYAEAIIAAAGNDDQPPPLAAVLFREVLDAEPQNGEALWYVGLAEAASGRNQEARDLWTRLLAQLPADAPARKEVESRLAALKMEPAK